MAQVLLRAIIKTLKNRHFLDDPDMAPAEMATEIMSELHVHEVGWVCGEDKIIKSAKECDDCYPVFRIKAIEE